MNTDELVTLSDAAAAVGVSRDTVYRTAVCLNRLPVQRVMSRQKNRLRARWMVRLSEVKSYFEQNRIIESLPTKE